ncbi:hypothetical protein AAY473_007269 [Plecturocebus cupreus]
MPTSHSFVNFLSISLCSVPTDLRLESEPTTISAPSSLEHRCSSLPGGHAEKKPFQFFFFKMGFHHVGQAGLELPTSGDTPDLASKVLGLQATSHRMAYQLRYSVIIEDIRDTEHSLMNRIIINLPAHFKVCLVHKNGLLACKQKCKFWKKTFGNLRQEKIELPQNILENWAYGYYLRHNSSSLMPITLMILKRNTLINREVEHSYPPFLQVEQEREGRTQMKPGGRDLEEFWSFLSVDFTCSMSISWIFGSNEAVKGYDEKQNSNARTAFTL